MSKKRTCAWCKKKFPSEDMVVKHAGKHNTYYCDANCHAKAIERKKKRELNKEKKNG